MTDEALPIDRVDAWLKERVPRLTGQPNVTQYSGGASNWTYRLHYPEGDFVLRRPPGGTKAKSAHDMAREYKVQRALRPHFPYVPEMIDLCADETILGAPFYVMAHLTGTILRRNLPEGMELNREKARTLSANVIDRLVELHGVDVRSTGLAELGKGPGYVKRQVEGWCDRYTKARTWNVPRFSRVQRWLRDRQPEDSGACLIHNDFRLDNLVLTTEEPTRIVGVLDWEMATVGDPLMDLGNSLAYWVEADDDLVAKWIRRQPTHLPGMLTRGEVVTRYLGATGRTLSSFQFYEVFGLFRLAAIIQQIYLRYHRRQTRNPAFRRFWQLVHYFHWRCLRALGRQR